MADPIKKYVGDRQVAYKTTFRTVSAEAVLADLAAFCRANESTFHENPRIAAMLDGRREVWLRIQQHLNLAPSDLYALSTGQQRRLETAIATSGEYDD